MSALKSQAPAARKCKLNCYVDQDMQDWLSAQAEHEGLTLSTFAAGLLEESRRRREEPEAEPMVRLAKHLDRLFLTMKEMRRDHYFFEEMFAMFVRVYLNHTPAIPEHRVRECSDSGSERFAKFQKYLCQQMGKRSILNDARSIPRPHPQTTMPEAATTEDNEDDGNDSQA